MVAIFVFIFSLMLVTLSVVAGQSNLCPDEQSIVPCTCIDNGGLLDLDCSQVTSEEELSSVFNDGVFQARYFHRFLISHSSQVNSSLNVLYAGVFNDIIFEIIEIKGTTYTTVESGVFSNMTSSLNQILMPYNQINVFPFSNLDYLFFLTILDLRTNALQGAYIRGMSLEELYLQENSLTDQTFSVATSSALQILELDDNQFLTVPNLKGLIMLDHISMVNNMISVLENDTFSDQQLKMAIFDHNIFENIHRDTFAGHITYDAIVDMVDNQFRTLDEEDWSAFLNELTIPGSLDLSENPLICGCDVAWLFAPGTTALSKISQSTTCSDGRPLHSLDPEIFTDYC